MSEFTELPALLDFLHSNGGRLVLSYDADPVQDGLPDKDHRAVVAIEFGREADDSDMAGGAAYGMANNLDDALIQAAAEIGIH